MRRPAAVLIAAVAMLGITGPALAAWAASGAATGQLTAGTLAAATGLGTSAGTPPHTAINVNFTPGSNPAGTTYTITRDKKKDGTAGPEIACSGITSSPCADADLTASTTYTYTIKAILGGWSTATAGSVNRKTADAPVTGSYNVVLSGSGSAGNPWTATTNVSVKNGATALAGYKVTGVWNGNGVTGVSADCTTTAAGVCSPSLTQSFANGGANTATFQVNSVVNTGGTTLPAAVGSHTLITLTRNSSSFVAL